MTEEEPAKEPTGESAKDDALEERKQELEEELERYANAGAYSPGLVKASRWVSRALYFIMAGVVVFLLFNRKEYTQKEMDRAVERASEFKEKLNNEREAKDEVESQLLKAELRAAKLKLEMQELTQGRPAADEAERRARDLIARAQGERALTTLWRKLLNASDADALDSDAAQEATSFIRRASQASGTTRLELVDQLAAHGSTAIYDAASESMRQGDDEVFRLGALLMGRLEMPEALAVLLERVKDETSPCRRRALLLAAETLTPGAVRREVGLLFEPEAWVGAVIWDGNVAQSGMVEAYRDAPDEHRLDLIAMLSEALSESETEFFQSVATSSRPLSERIIAVRWLGKRGGAGARDLLRTLSEGQGVIAEEALQALED